MQIVQGNTTSVFKQGNIGLAILIGILSAAIVFVLIAMTSPRYKAQMDFLVIQNTSTTDFYALFKSSEFLGELLADAIHTEHFINQVMAVQNDGGVILPADKKKRLTAWKKIVSVSTDDKLGRLHVVVLHDNIDVAQNIAQTVARVLIDKNVAFRGGAESSVIVRLLTGPILESHPSMGTIAFVVVSAFFAGAVGTLSVIYVYNVRREKVSVQRALYKNSSSDIDLSHVDEEKEWDESFGAIAQKLHDLSSK